MPHDHPTTSSSTIAAERYAEVVESLLQHPGVTFGSRGRKGFGSTAIKLNGKIVAMLMRERLVLKLPRPRVDALVTADVGERFEPGPGRQMKEWVTIGTASEAPWLPLAHEALAFAATKQ